MGRRCRHFYNVPLGPGLWHFAGRSRAVHISLLPRWLCPLYCSRSLAGAAASYCGDRLAAVLQLASSSHVNECLGIADGRVSADGKVIYKAKDMRVGLIKRGDQAT